jgi:serine phosphatase RsbU (regulator of sigma subunit)/PAS domain-containing protein
VAAEPSTPPARSAGLPATAARRPPAAAQPQSAAAILLPADASDPGASSPGAGGVATSVTLTSHGAPATAAAPPADDILRALLHSGAAVFALYDLDGRYVQVSEAMAELNGVAAAAHRGRCPSEVLPEQIAAPAEAALARVLADARPRLELEYRTAVFDPDAPDAESERADPVAEPRRLESHWSAVRDAAGRQVGVLCVVRDVTDKHRIADLLGSTQWRIGKLQTVARELAGALTIGEVRAAVAKLAQVTGAVHVDLRLIDPLGRSPWPRNRPARALPAPRGLGRDEEDRWERRTIGWPPLLTAAVRAGQPCYLSGPASVRERFPEAALWPSPSGLERAWAVLPLVTAAGPVGGLYLVYESERSFDEDDQAFLQALAGQCTMAVARARMHEREHRQVVSLQDALLPKRLPELPGVEAAFRYIPGSLDTEVGGDWYDLFGFPDGRVGMVVGDVIGKGVTAAAGMGRVRAALRALAFTDPSPRAVLTGLDRLFDATENAESLTTVVYALFDPASGSLLMADAGHLPLLVLSASGEPRYVETVPAATPLGWSEDRVEHRIALNPGDLVLGFSDGLVETRDASLDHGLERLRAAVRGGGGDPEFLLDHVLDTMLRDQEQDDDVTLLAVRVAGPEPAAG